MIDQIIVVVLVSFYWQAAFWYVVRKLRLDKMMFVEVEPTEEGAQIAYFIVVLDIREFLSAGVETIYEEYGRIKACFYTYINLGPTSV